MKKNKLFICLIALIVIFAFVANVNAVVRFEGYEAETTYTEYQQQFQEKPRPDREIYIRAVDFTDETTLPIEITNDIEGSTQPSLIIPERDPEREERGFVEWEIMVEEAGLYNIEFKYYPVEGRGSTIERDLWINGERPFREARTLEFTRVWTDTGPLLRDEQGNHIRAPQGEVPMWRTVTLKDALGYHVRPFRFYFEEGRNTIKLYSLSEPMALEHIRIFKEEEAPSYTELVQQFEEKGYQETGGHFIKVQGQDATLRSDNTLVPTHDMGDPTVEPYHPAQIRMNSIGGYRWRHPGQWITWEFEVPEDGLYNISFKAKQDQERGIATYRRILLNGEVPYEELYAVPFLFSSSYRMRTLGEEVYGQPFLFYLEEGTHQISMEVVLGDLAEFIRRVESELYDMNAIYRRIIMITSPNPDPLRDYQLADRIPNIIEILGEQAQIFTEIADALQVSEEQMGEQIAHLREIARLLNQMHDQPHRIPDVLSEYRDNIGALGNWIYRMRQQALQIDYLIVSSPDQELPRAEPSFIDQLRHEARAFVSTFTFDYDQIGAGQMTEVEFDEKGEIIETPDTEVRTDDRDSLVVWVGTGRDQAQVLKQMAEDSFTPNTDIPVHLELITRMRNILIPAIVAGTAPDVAIGAQNMELAFRDGLLDLSTFEDFAEITDKRFKPSALVPFTFRDQVYAMPEQQTYAVLYYRKDILQELGLEVPRTWTDIYEVLPVLQRHNMNVGLTPNIGAMLMFLYQKQVSLYEPDMVATNLDSETSIRTFREMANLYTLYNLPIQFNFQNRFRMGEMPLAIRGYTEYRNLQVFAPELRGEWSFTLIPGTRMEDGRINHTIPITGGDRASVAGLQGARTTGSVILKDSEMREEAWEFVKWWTSAEMQARFGRELEALMGEAARHPTANVEAMEMLPWPPDLRSELNKQWEWTEGIPPVPGAYYVSRQFDWLYRAVVLQNEPVREAAQDYTRRANNELVRKRSEFGYETSIEDVDEVWIRQFWDKFSHINRLEVDEFKRRR